MKSSIFSFTSFSLPIPLVLFQPGIVYYEEKVISYVFSGSRVKLTERTLSIVPPTRDSGSTEPILYLRCVNFGSTGDTLRIKEEGLRSPTVKGTKCISKTKPSKIHPEPFRKNCSRTLLKNTSTTPNLFVTG